jgi:hypothetical protein
MGRRETMEVAEGEERDGGPAGGTRRRVAHGARHASPEKRHGRRMACVPGEAARAEWRGASEPAERSERASG